MIKNIFFILFLLKISSVYALDTSLYEINKNKKSEISNVNIEYYYWNMCEDCKKIRNDFIEFKNNNKNFNIEKKPVILGLSTYDNVGKYYLTLKNENTDISEDFYNYVFDKSFKKFNFKDFRNFLNEKIINKSEILDVLKKVNTEKTIKEMELIKEKMIKNKIDVVPTILIDNKYMINEKNTSNNNIFKIAQDIIDIEYNKKNDN